MVPVPAGPVRLGTTPDELSLLRSRKCVLPDAMIAQEKPREFRLKASYYIDKYPVTVAAFAEFADRLGPQVRNELGIGRLHPLRDGNLPATGITWRAAVRFAEEHRKRLPTEAEWEKAAGFDPITQHKRIFPWGDMDEADMRNHGSELAEVFTYEVGASALGCCDLVGNALEWCADPFLPEYEPRPYDQVSLVPSADGRRTVRGGWFERGPLECRVAWRAGESVETAPPFAGFRCVRDVPLRDPLRHER